MDIKQVSYTKFRMHLASFIDQATKSNLPLLITRRNNKPAYLVSKEMYEYLVKQNFDKLETNNSATTAPKKIKANLQKPVQVTTATQQDLFN